MELSPSDESQKYSLTKFESMLKTNNVFFFDSNEFESIIHHYLEIGKVALAKKAINLGLDQHPSSINLRLFRVEILIFENDFNAAEKLLNTLFELEPNNEELYIQRANIYSKKDQHQKAIDTFKEAIKIADDCSEIHSLIGMEYLFLNEYEQAKVYRESYEMFAVNGILFNHESPRRGETFVTRKITRAATRIKFGLQNKLILGNLDSKRDWGYAKEYVEAMWLMLQQDEPDDYVIATNETHTVREFLEETFACLDLDWNEFVGFDKKYERPAEVDLLIGNPEKAKKQLGWEPKTTFKELVALMVQEDMKLAQREKALTEANLS